MRLRVFVYGTLKQGQSNHERFCRGFISAQEATIQGQLYELPYGFPALVVPEADVQAIGTTDYLADVEVQSHARAGPHENPTGWDTVYGELISFDDPEERLPALDRLEGFHPGEKSLYKRVLIPVTLSGTSMVEPAWTYVVEPVFGRYLPGGRWPPD